MPQNGIRMDGVAALAHGLAKCPRLQHVDLQDNTFTADGETAGVEAWTEALKSWPELTTLNLSDCVLSGDGEVPLIVKALAAGSNPKLHTLQLQNNNFETETFLTLANGVSTMASLMLLELQWNDIELDDENIKALALGLKRRGGKLLASDDDEEEEEEEAANEPEETSEPVTAEKAKEVDDLAELLSKVDIH
jgi:Ran GTPase-activating protein 1